MAEANSKVRSAWSLFQPPMDPAALAAAKAKAAKRHELEDRAAASLNTILKDFAWDVEDILEDGRYGKFIYQTNVFLETMFKGGDFVWVGDPEDSGQEKHRNHFLQIREWLKLDPAGNYTCASTFLPDTFSRSNVRVQSTPYMIVEGDKINGIDTTTTAGKISNKNACGAIFNWLRNGCGLDLRAVVDAGNKSLHGWFTMPRLEKFEELKVVLPAMGCDRAMFKPTQPARIPGVIRDNGNQQKLLWIK